MPAMIRGDRERCRGVPCDNASRCPSPRAQRIKDPSGRAGGAVDGAEPWCLIRVGHVSVCVRGSARAGSCREAVRCACRDADRAIPLI